MKAKLLNSSEARVEDFPLSGMSLESDSALPGLAITYLTLT